MNKNKLSKKIIITTLIFIIGLITISTVNAADPAVNNTNLGNLVTNTSPGSTIELGEGRYNNNATNITISKNITIVGKGVDKTIIDAQHSGRVFNIRFNGILTLINLTVINGNISGSGGAIANNGKLTIKNCNFINNTALGDSAGGGAISSSGSLNIENSNFTQNKANSNGGAIESYYNANITNSNFNNNMITGGIGHGGAINNNADMMIIGCNFTNNIGGESGGAITYGGGATESMIIKNSNFINNIANHTDADSYGGAIMLFESAIITGCNFSNNAAIASTEETEGYGGAICVIFNDDGKEIIITNCNFNYNDAIYGGAIFNCHSMIINNSNFLSNTLSAIYNTNFFFIGYDDNVNLHVFNSNFKNNNLAIFTDGNLTLKDCNITNNSQGILINYTTENTTITGCNIINNSQGIFINSSLENITINYNRIFNNTNYDLYNNDSNINVDFNWWGNNTPTKIIGVTPNNYFVMNVINLTSLGSNGTVKFSYIFELNNSNTFNSTLLPYFVTDIHTNVTDGVINSFDARFNRTFDVILNTSGNILYTFITDNEVQTLEGMSVIPEPAEPSPTPTPTPTPEPTSKNNTTQTNETSKNPLVSASMKETGIPIIAILLVLLTSLGLLIRRE